MARRSIERYIMERTLVYLATPYSHKDWDVRERRFEKVNQVAGELLTRGEIIFSPISHTHPIAKVCDLPKDWEYWDGLCRAYMACCYKMYVLMIDGWKESVGVQAEIKIAEEAGMEIVYIKYEDYVKEENRI